MLETIQENTPTSQQLNHLSPDRPETKRNTSPKGNYKLQTTNYKQIQNTKTRNSKQTTKTDPHLVQQPIFIHFTYSLINRIPIIQKNGA